MKLALLLLTAVYPALNPMKFEPEALVAHHPDLVPMKIE